MNQEKTNTLAPGTLRDKLAGCRLTASAFEPNFRLEALFDQVTTCRIIKENERRQVYHLATPQTGYYLKIATLVRPKDRWRHFFLPNRKWSEWRNLHRLLKMGITAAKPVLKGEDSASHPARFFILTEEVPGLPIKIETGADAYQLGEFTARLHARGIYHSDLHPANLIMTHEGHPRLIDVQQVIFLPWLPHRLRVSNAGKFYNHLRALKDSAGLSEKFIDGYNSAANTGIKMAQLVQAADRHRQIKFRSRSKRCCRNTSQFEIVKDGGWKGYKRKSFHWSLQDLRQALDKGEVLKGAHVISFQGVCIKKHLRRPFHKNRCLTSWKMSRALEVRGISVPRALGYFIFENTSCFLSEMLESGLPLNEYLSSISDERTKRRALKKLALWLQKFYDTHVWQRDFKSDNILCRKGEYFMLDLDGVKVCRWNAQMKIINLAQLNASVSNAISLKDRLRFYHYLTGAPKTSKQRRRADYRKIWEITRNKTTFYYDLDLDKLCKVGR